jgi:hypothetical protein
MDTHPKHDIALGAVRYHLPATGEPAPPAATTVAPGPSHAVEAPAVAVAPGLLPAADEAPRARRRRMSRRAVIGAAATLVLLLGAAATYLVARDTDRDGATLPVGGTRVLPEDFLLVPLRADPEDDAQLYAVSVGGQGMVEFDTPVGFYYDNPWISRDGTLAGFRLESSLYRGMVTDDGQIDGTTLEPVLRDTDPTEESPEGSPDSTLQAISFLPSGTIAVQYGGGQDPGIHLLDEGPPRRLTSGAHDDFAVASPELPWVAFVRDGDLYVVSAGDNEPPCPAPRQREVDEVTKAPLCNLTGESTSLPSALALFPTWSWDGERIAFTIGEEDGLSTLSLVSLSDPGDPKPLVEEPGLFGPPAWGPR